MQGHYFIKRYLALALIVLMLITSMGIFGFLSKAHLEQTGDSKQNYANIEFIERKIGVLEREKEFQYQSLNRLNAEAEQYFKYGAISKSKEKQKAEREEIKLELERINGDQQNLRIEKFELESKNRVFELEVGPVLYVAELIYGDEAKSRIDSAVRAVIIALIFVFDPLAILLLIASQISLNAHTTTRKVEVLTDEYETRDYRKTSGEVQSDDVEDTEGDGVSDNHDVVSDSDDTGNWSDDDESIESQDDGIGGENETLTEHERVERKKRRLGAGAISQM